LEEEEEEEKREGIEVSRFPPQTAWAQIGFDHVGDAKRRACARASIF
jgi:hypothetical protein